MKKFISMFVLMTFLVVCPGASYQLYAQASAVQTVELSDEEKSLLDRVFSEEAADLMINVAIASGVVALGGQALLIASPYIAKRLEGLAMLTHTVGGVVSQGGLWVMLGSGIVFAVLGLGIGIRAALKDKTDKVSLGDLNDQFAGLKVEEAYLSEALDNPFLASNYWVSQKLYLESTVDYVSLVSHPQQQAILAGLDQQLSYVDDELSSLETIISLLTEEQAIVFANQESNIIDLVDADGIRHDVELAIKILEHRITGSPPSRG